MLVIKAAPVPSFKTFPVVAKHNFVPLCNATFGKLLQNCQKAKVVQHQNTDQVQLKRLLHTTQVNRDLESAIKAIGAGVAATGVIGPGVGMGLIFGNLISSTARNPSVTNKIFQFSIMGAALCESLGLFALLISFLVIYG